MTKRSTLFEDRPVTIEAVYGVSGLSNSEQFPYVNNIASLRKAVEIAKHYEGVNSAKGAGRVKRSLNIYGEGRHIRFMTHEWYVYKDGIIELSQWGKRSPNGRSPVRALSESIEDDKQMQALMEEASERSTSQLTPRDYNNVASCVIDTLLRNARQAGFMYVYYANEQHRSYGEQFLIDRVNEALAFSGYRTLEQETLKPLLEGTIRLNDAIHNGFVYL